MINGPGPQDIWSMNSLGLQDIWNMSLAVETAVRGDVIVPEIAVVAPLEIAPDLDIALPPATEIALKAERINIGLAVIKETQIGTEIGVMITGSRPNTPPRSQAPDHDIFATISTKYAKKRAESPPPATLKNFDPYEVFNEPRDASQETLQKSYKRLMIEYHPDKQTRKSDEEKKWASKKVADGNHARGILGDPEKRMIHDETGDTDDYTIREKLEKKKKMRENKSSWALVRPGAEDDAGKGGKFNNKLKTLFKKL
ncbi:hypothetical protein K458DRAFT_403541 [Lentithecium fluviatile CBS 122367]|uniref:J domain-containing protein n=1 Tax=Lentithecium fluviatile CBS 122367 TaxID=1168545 RepID=A0A6G1J477_9PLEO|nr:hypothetical protein K458DRAFT_403541 [Lentithecium fluviatile CBS 122367]